MWPRLLKRLKVMDAIGFTVIRQALGGFVSRKGPHVDTFNMWKCLLKDVRTPIFG